MSYTNLKADRSERVAYDKADYPAYLRKGRLSFYPNYTAESHWHDDLEFIYILSGQMQYNINGTVILLKPGEGLFVNSRQLHFGYSDTRQECEFLCVLLHPALLCSTKTVEQNYVAPILSGGYLPFCHLTGVHPWENQILTGIQTMYANRNDPLFELKIQRTFYDIWIALWENTVSRRQPDVFKNQHLSELMDMLSFIHENYREKLTLDAIAKSGNMGKTGCCGIFRRTLNKTPMEYVTELRLRKAMELLRQSDRTVLEISYEVGFSGASYFTETFRKFYGCTPKEYRRRSAAYASLTGADT